MLFRYSILTSAFVLLSADSIRADLIYSLDLDSLTPGIQSDISAKAGDSVVADVIMQLTGNTSIGNYSITLRFDTTEMSFTSGTESPPSPLLSLLPLDNNTVGEINGIEAGVLVGNGPVAPFTTKIATLTFNVFNPTGTSSDIDILLLDDGIFDGSFDNSSAAIVPRFNGASISLSAVPEPSGLFLIGIAFVAGSLIFGLREYRRSSPLR